MRRKFLIVVALAGLMAAGGCYSGGRHVIKLKDGSEYVSTGSPHLDKKTQTYEFEDEKGSLWHVSKEDVKNIEDAK